MTNKEIYELVVKYYAGKFTDRCGCDPDRRAIMKLEYKYRVSFEDFLRFPKDIRMEIARSDSVRYTDTDTYHGTAMAWDAPYYCDDHKPDHEVV